MKCLIILLLLMVNLILAKQYKRCELAKELLWKHNVPLEDVGMLVCVAEERSSLNSNALLGPAHGIFQMHSPYWCSKTEIGGGCIMNCSDLLNDDITDDVKCVKRILLAAGYNAWGLAESCIPKSKVILKECFGDVLDHPEQRTCKENDDISPTTHNGTLIVDFVDLMVESIKSFDAGKTSSQNHSTINNYFVFNINGNEVQKIKLVSDKTTPTEY